MQGDILYSVSNIFQSIQGEGFFTGTPANFIRLYGCDVQCPFCDSMEAWRGGNYDRLNIHAILLRLGYNVKHTVITGGEPFLHDLAPLVAELIKKKQTVQIETSGTQSVSSLAGLNYWLTVSPKKYKAHIKETIIRANEIKFPVESLEDIESLRQLLPDVLTKNIYLQPISQLKEATDICIDAVLENNWRLSVQVHKFLDIE
jgi:7-carboxy-7-deazaguanine synthase